jgi:hypothetical protein
MTLPRIEDFSGYLHVYVISKSGPLTMIEYLTPDNKWSTHVWQADVFRTTADLELALIYVRALGLVPNMTPSDEQPADPRYHGPQKPSAWRQWK